MVGNKWRSFESAILALPLVFLLLYLFRVPLPLPAALLPERSYVAFSSAEGSDELKKARGGSAEALALLPDRLLPLPSASASPAEWKAANDHLPNRATLEALRGDLERGFPLLRRATLVTDFIPDAGELEGLEALAKAKGIPLELRIEEKPEKRSFLKSFSWRAGDTGELLSFDLLFDAAAASDSLDFVVSARRSKERPAKKVFAPRPGGSSLDTIWSGRGSRLPKDLALRLSTTREGLEALVLTVNGPEGETSTTLRTGSEPSYKPRVLVIGRHGAATSLIENLYATERATPEAAAKMNLPDYELIVLDGVPLRDMKGALGRALSDTASRRLASLLFVADSPEFGAPGDNPEIESLLPVTLLPRSLKDLPDIAILVLLDDSGSMFGGKLSLAKVASLELLKGLKKTDRVGLMLFSDRRHWVWNFQPNSSIVAAPVLEPVEAEGGTELGLALSEGIDRLAGEPIKEKHIVVISDGVTRPADFVALAARARERGISISTMGVGDDLDQPLLEKLAQQAKGRFYRVNTAEEIPALLFEDRKSEARAPFNQGSIPILDLAGTRVAVIGGMAQYAARPEASVLYADEVGDPLFAGIETGNKAIMLFASDLYGTYTSDFFSKPAIVATLRDRLDALFTSRPPEISVLETARELRLVVRSDALAAPSLRLTQAGSAGRDAFFKRIGQESWEASAVLPEPGIWRASLVDRGAALASFDLARNEGISGVDAASAAALRDYRGGAWRIGEAGALWLLLFFAAALGATIVLRMRR